MKVSGKITSRCETWGCFICTAITISYFSPNHLHILEQGLAVHGCSDMCRSTESGICEWYSQKKELKGCQAKQPAATFPFNSGCVLSPPAIFRSVIRPLFNSSLLTVTKFVSLGLGSCNTVNCCSFLSVSATDVRNIESGNKTTTFS